ncbi:hypothetical protein GQ457_04G010850 [Hibiscus cannabinus]
MSCYRLLLPFFILVFLLLHPLEASTPPPPSRSRHSCDSFSRSEQRSLCFQLQRLHHFHPFSPSTQPSPPSKGEEIDPRYGVEKRLVPSGPNPLHN